MAEITGPSPAKKSEEFVISPGGPEAEAAELLLVEVEVPPGVPRATALGPGPPAAGGGGVVMGGVATGGVVAGGGVTAAGGVATIVAGKGVGMMAPVLGTTTLSS